MTEEKKQEKSAESVKSKDTLNAENTKPETAKPEILSSAGEQPSASGEKSEKKPIADSGEQDTAKATKMVKKSKSKRQVLRGRASIQCTYNNTMIMLADAQGGTLAWSSSGMLGFKGAKKSTPYAATQVVADVAEKVRKYQLKELTVSVKGVGSGREAAIRALANHGFDILSIKDITPIAHNGCRPRRPRRV